jgi:excisionase family DNA binding protein
MTTPLLKVADAANILGMSERTVLDELRRKNLVGVKTPSGWRIDEADLGTYIESHKNVRPVRRSA